MWEAVNGRIMLQASTGINLKTHLKIIKAKKG
jgi:hypothetical protein